ncbi:DUF192 domain-containing protein [Candidatus Woesearchaeota archaeon]|nr:DUF192 domain-containing protein [Candidatus Woesearchaeota archaeon]
MIKNLSKKSVIAAESEIINGILPKFMGLMFSRKMHRALIFRFDREMLISLHMFFVFHPIDVLFLDKNKAIVDKKESFRPFALYSSRRKAMYAIELHAGCIKKSRTGLGDKIEF